MKKLIYVLLICLFADAVSASVVINQVLYDPIVSESTGEAVELYNNGASVDISGWMLKTEASAQDATVPANTILQAESYYLIADSGWNATLRQADLEETISLYNTDSGVALLDEEFYQIDAVGWGNINETGLYEGIPANPVTEGNVLKRVNDTDSNLLDFIEAAPNFVQTITTNELVLEVNVISPLNFDITITPDDSELAGFQVMPNPGEAKTITIKANTTENLNLTANFQNQIKPMTLIGGVYQVDFDLDYSMLAGTYSVTIISNNFEKEQQFEYLGLTALEIDTTKIVFDDVIPGNDVFVYGDNNMDTTNQATIQNIGNTNLDVSVYGTDLVSGDENIPVTSVMFSFDNEFDYVLSDRLDYESIFFDLNLAPTLNNELGFKLNVPIDAIEGKYTGKVSIVGVGS